ncbi:DUF317 domain-containing protein [Kitasatospora sp. NPDC097605]|uniref:DUF317 domain-containing protein n=1 Tax=Kitasatospora sp. NPDC097605 TaxID=3157226 RepID=UPI0033263B45
MSHANVLMSPKPQVNDGTRPREHLLQHPPLPVRPTIDQRSWLSSGGSAEPVLALLAGLGWPVMDTHEGDVHCTSPDGLVYVGWLPEDPSAWRRGIVWRIQVRPSAGPPWAQEFGATTPSEAFAGFLAALIANPGH